MIQPQLGSKVPLTGQILLVFNESDPSFDIASLCSKRVKENCKIHENYCMFSDACISQKGEFDQKVLNLCKRLNSLHFHVELFQ